MGGGGGGGGSTLASNYMVVTIKIVCCSYMGEQLKLTDLVTVRFWVLDVGVPSLDKVS